MLGPILFILVFTTVLWYDFVLFVKIVIKHGPQWNVWPGSGFWLTWKFRQKNPK